MTDTRDATAAEPGGRPYPAPLEAPGSWPAAGPTGVPASLSGAPAGPAGVLGPGRSPGVPGPAGSPGTAVPDPSRALPRRGTGVAGASILSMIALVAVGLTRLIHGSLISHATDRSTYGVVGMLLATTTIASLVLPGGVSSAMAKFVAYQRGAGDLPAARAVYRYLSRIAIGSSIPLGIGAAVVADLMHPLSLWDAAAVCLLTIAYSMYTVDKAALYGFSRVAPYVRLEIATSTLAVASTVLIVLLGLHAYLLPLAIGYGVFAIGARWLVRTDLHEPGSRRGVFPRGEVNGYIGLSSIGTLSGQGFLQGTQLLAAWFVAPAGVAYFTASVALVAPLYFLPRALGLALFPAMANAHGAGDLAGVRQQADLSTRALVTVLAPLFIAGGFLAPQVLAVFGGGQYAGGATVLRLMLVATYLSVIQVPAINALSSAARWRPAIPAVAAVAGAVVGLAMVALFGHSLGGNGVALAYLVGSVINAGIPMLAVWREHRMRWAGSLARALLVVTAGFIVAVLLDRDHSALLVLAVGAATVGVSVLVLLGDLTRLAASVPRRARASGAAGSGQHRRR